MSFEDFDKKLREAADNHQPAFNENAWQNMERMLDEHLPQEDGRRRRFFLWLLFGLVLGGALFLSVIRKNSPLYSEQKPKQEITGKPAAENNSNETPASQQEKNIIPPADQIKKIDAHASLSPELVNGPGNGIAGSKEINPSSSLKEKQNAFKVKEKRIAHALSVHDENNIAALRKQNVAGEVLNDNAGKSQKNITDTNTTNGQQVNEPVPLTGNETVGGAAPANKSATKEKNAKQPKGFADRFSISISAGPAISAVEIDRPGKLTVSYGAGANYRISKKLSVGAGFLVSRKMYDAGPADYHPPAGYWTYNYDLKKVEANCKVYELPLAINFMITEKERHQFFASAGLSSYIMKSETYHYLYKDLAGQTRYRGWTLKNGKEHYFSVLALGGGYQYKVSNRTSFIIQPVVKIPLKGIGFGNIKLADAGTYFTWQVKPFARR